MSSPARPTRTDTVVPKTRPAPQKRPANVGTVIEDIDIVDIWGRDSFPASDPPANW
jgi:hypothetical protein